MLSRELSNIIFSLHDNRSAVRGYDKNNENGKNRSTPGGNDPFFSVSILYCLIIVSQGPSC